ncbi:aminotransferase class I/II-fold pyridoxal phosphate-dependent enzyme [Nostoc sp. UHCC 0252]|uniref:aminotransferase class I/II-fold pyridoxal phosphate-dependent enzyme n=1 Tax=Nostoc sp. UHCC 0252 TaxID=3110241 RepID=UPI002B217134|nr:aminotransferase class I/II-fold pyridoxal phosphate-dependent enzyme [Nostoc sp. UHCC 0252]MEA5604222.1 aminotransferase class I/II-fold pyridoxal phosphate-dependent enzyme [Nostoc sp. UHCC 0252]
MLNQNQTPLLDALKTNAARLHAPFYTPGHKLGEGISQPLANLLGKAVFRADLTELADLDNLFTPQGVIQEAQQLAAAAFGASQTWFLVNGSTCGIEAAILATCGTGDKIILPRNVHSSAIAGLILSGAIPIFLNPEYDSVLDIAHSITPNALESALQQHPDAKAVLTVYPTYYGVCGDLSAIANITHQHNIPLLVDEAHGAHFAFHPELPTPALAAGADLTVQSIHKVLGAMTQASMLHIQGDRIDCDRISKALQLVQSTSPSYLLLASLDAARQQMALHGKMLMSRTLQLANEARTKISQIPGLSVLQILSPPYQGGLGGSSSLGGLVGSPSFMTLDETRLTVTVSGLGLTGFEAEEILDEKFAVTAEFASLQHLTFIISLGNTPADIEQLVQSFTTLANEYHRTNLITSSNEQNLLTTQAYTLHLSPREAFFAVSETLPLAQTSDRICAEIVCPYPPGIPVLMPGEIITKPVINYLQQIQVMGGFISGCTDTNLKTLKVVK